MYEISKRQNICRENQAGADTEMTERQLLLQTYRSGALGRVMDTLSRAQRCNDNTYDSCLSYQRR
jgi:hypothetical protein